MLGQIMTIYCNDIVQNCKTRNPNIGKGFPA